MAAEKAKTAAELIKLEGTARSEEALRALGVNPEEISQLQYAIWAPWARGEALHADDPVAFRGKYQGYKMITKMVDGKLNTFGGFIFDDANGPNGQVPAGRANGYIFFNTILLDDLGRVEAGTEMAIVWMGERPNKHGGKTHDIRANVVNGKLRSKVVGGHVLPPLNAELKGLLGPSREIADGELSDEGGAIPDVREFATPGKK